MYSNDSSKTTRRLIVTDQKGKSSKITINGEFTYWIRN